MQNLTCEITPDEITEHISSVFDYSFTDGQSVFVPPKFDVEALDEDFQIGLIVGPSGTGKSTILREYFGNEPIVEWDESKAICSHFDSAQDAEERLGAVGLNSIPAWVKPYHVLSEGEKFRAKVARLLKSGAVIDEFTSVVDRQVAKACSYAIQRYVRVKGLRRIVFCTCHYDVAEWLAPDWTFDTSAKDGRMSTERSVRRPEIVLELLPASPKAWSMFSTHHYLDANINKSARCWLAVWDGTVVGFTSALTFPSGTVKNAWRGHRTVVLPEFQGLGLGVRISDAAASIFVSQGCRFFSKTAHPRMGEYREKSPNWRPTSTNKKHRKDYSSMKANKFRSKSTLAKHIDRICYSHEFIGDCVQ